MKLNSTLLIYYLLLTSDTEWQRPNRWNKHATPLEHFDSTSKLARLGGENLGNGSDGVGSCPTAPSHQGSTNLAPLAYIRHKIFICNASRRLQNRHYIIRSYISRLTYEITRASRAEWFDPVILLTTHNFLSLSYVSPLLGYTSMGLFVTCTNHIIIVVCEETAMSAIESAVQLLELDQLCYTFRIDCTSPWMYLGGVQLIPTLTTCGHESAIEAQSSIESPLTAFIPSLELKENQAGTLMFSSSTSAA